MSTTVFSKQNPSPVQTRRNPIKNDDIENNAQRPKNRRSLSGKFRSLFRKDSSSSNHPTNNDERPPPAPPRERSPSPEPIRASTEAPHLRAPIVNWPFGKKKNKLTATTSVPTKTKGSRKSKKTSIPTMNISSPLYQEDHQSSIRGQDFIPRTPEFAHDGAGRTQSSSSYDTTTKGFRDYMVIDNAKSSQQLVVPDIDVITPPPYTSDRSRSPSLNHQHLPDTKIDYPYHHDTSPPISDIEIIPIPKQYTVGNTPSLNTTTTQILVEKTPLLPQTSISHSTVTQPTNAAINSNQWKNTSYSSSLNNNELRSTTSSSIDVDIPKLNAPFISLSNTSNKKESQRTDSQSRSNDTYNSLATVNNLNQPNRSYINTYGSLPDTDAMHNDSLTPLKPIKSNLNKYPGLSAIVEHHMRPISVHFDKRSPAKTRSPQQTQRFDTSTTTLNNFDQPQQFTTTLNNGSGPSPSSIHRHDGFIRPLTPQTSSVQPDVHIIDVDLDDLRGRSPSRTIHSNSSEPPIIYRSSTTIYTKDKHNYTDGGELRTWSIQGNDDIDRNRKPSTSIQLVPSKVTNEYPYNSKAHEQEEEKYEIFYEPERQRPYQYSDNINNDRNSNFPRSSTINDREKISDQSIRSYKDIGYTQVPLNTINSEGTLRHYTLKRTDSYDGLGLLITADVETHLNHRIRDIEIGSPSSRVGLRRNDRIINVNGINVEKTEFGDVLVLIKEGLNNNNLKFSVINDSILL